MSSFLDRFAPLHDLVRRQRLPLVSRTVIIGGVALLDWDLQQAARFGAEIWGQPTRTTEDIDVVIAAADDRGWLEALTAAGWQRDSLKRYRWRPPAIGAEQPCIVDLLGQYGGESGHAGGSEWQLQDYWGGEDGAYICRVLRAYQGQRKFPSMVTEPFWDPTMQSFQWLRLNHLGLALSKISAVGIVLVKGDAEHQRGVTATSRLRKDLQDLLRLLRDEVAATITGWQGQVILDELVPARVAEVLEHLRSITDVASGSRPSPHLGDENRQLLTEVADRLPIWRVKV